MHKIPHSRIALLASNRAGCRLQAQQLGLHGARDLLGGENAVFDRAGLTAVIEETGGVKSYWALAHASREPDFHDPATFRMRISRQ